MDVDNERCLRCQIMLDGISWVYRPYCDDCWRAVSATYPACRYCARTYLACLEMLHLCCQACRERGGHSQPL